MFVSAIAMCERGGSLEIELRAAITRNGIGRYDVGCRIEDIRAIEDRELRVVGSGGVQANVNAGSRQIALGIERRGRRNEAPGGQILVTHGGGARKLQIRDDEVRMRIA